MADIPASIFKAYGIRGIVGKTLNEDIVERIGHAIGSEAMACQQYTIAKIHAQNASPSSRVLMDNLGSRNAGTDSMTGSMPAPARSRY